MLNFIFRKNLNNTTKLKKLFFNAYSSVKNKDFSKAIDFYNEIFQIYSNLKEKQKTKKLTNDIKILYTEITLYLKLNEAYISAISGNLKLLKEELERLRDISCGVHKTKSQPIEIKQIQNTNTKIQSTDKFYLKIYTRKITLADFEFKIGEINNYFSENTQNIKNSDSYNRLILTYIKANIMLLKILPYLPNEKKIKLYSKLRKAFKNLVLHIPINNKSKTSNKKTNNENLKYLSFEDTFQKIQECLKKGDMKTATKLYKYL